MFDFGFNWFGAPLRSKRPKTLDQYLWRNDAVKTRIGSSAVSLSSPPMEFPKAIDGYALADQYALLNGALRKQVQHMTRENRDLTIAGMEKDTKIEEFRQTVESLLIEKNLKEIELERAYDGLYGLVAAITDPNTDWYFDGYDIQKAAPLSPECPAASTFFSDMLDAEAEQIPEKTKPFWAR